jgi:glycosidase
MTRLDQIPDEELDTLARRGITGLWLIGLWERSPASQRIKQMMGNPEAVASAYSLLDYRIASDLGGEAALNDLRARAWRRGIRLASDMVPNHMGIDSRWVMEHPDWFIQLDYSPFPSYTFNGPDLSWIGHVGIYIEDHYYTRTDAAVVFKHVDRTNGRERYIYHGNDGTSMPWNDTAQLNYLKPEVREAVIQTILHVARQFPIIRFDAAMTLTKKHYQRLWFPEPGSGGDIPSRAEHGMTRAQFDALMPQEFWREVVDRVAREAPDTLLLAEAFWLMEGYFVRTLGMHRVYNSAFMNMLRDELNAEYRQVVKNTLEFDPEILKRYVNFMNNPDERTAVDQFGKGDKYFGVCTLMATLPGLPMFGHGQIEGFTEKYGMEFRRAQLDEQPDPHLVERHEREIFPLLHRRHVFAEATNFLLYDFFTPDGAVDENVFAYSNRAGDERGLVIYHNAYAETRGWIRWSAAYATKSGPAGERTLVRKHLGEGLALHAADDAFCIARDQAHGLEYLWSSKELWDRGLYVELGAYQRRVFIDIHEVRDDAQRHYARLAAQLGGRGVPSVAAALRELTLEPVRAPFRELVQADLFRRLMAARVATPDGHLDPVLLDEIEGKMRTLLRAAKDMAGGQGDEAAVARQVRRELAAVLALPALAERVPSPGRAAAAAVRAQLGDDPAVWGTLFAWVFTHALGQVVDEQGAAERARAWLEEWLLERIVAGALRDLGLDAGAAWHWSQWLKALIGHQDWFAGRGTAGRGASPMPDRVLEAWFADGEVRRFLQVKRHDGVLWFNHEAFEQCLWWMLTVAAVQVSAAADQAPEQLAMALAARARVLAALRQAEAASAYQVDALLRAAQGIAPATARAPRRPVRRPARRRGAAPQ